jgi:hypothetical protein
VQQDSSQHKNQSIEQLDEVIEEIRELMLRLAMELVNKRTMDERKPTRSARMMQEHSGEARSRGTTPFEIEFQQHWRAHEQNFCSCGV